MNSKWYEKDMKTKQNIFFLWNTKNIFKRAMGFGNYVHTKETENV